MIYAGGEADERRTGPGPALPGQDQAEALGQVAPAGGQTGQESRSAGHRAATSLAAMDITIHVTFKE